MISRRSLNLLVASFAGIGADHYARYKGEKTPSLFDDAGNKSWDEDLHPRVEKGSKEAHGGQFTSKHGDSDNTKPKPQQLQPMFGSSYRPEAKAKQQSLFETMGGGGSQMPLFPDDATPTDLLSPKKPIEGQLLDSENVEAAKKAGLSAKSIENIKKSDKIRGAESEVDAIKDTVENSEFVPADVMRIKQLKDGMGYRVLSRNRETGQQHDEVFHVAKLPDGSFEVADSTEPTSRFENGKWSRVPFDSEQGEEIGQKLESRNMTAGENLLASQEKAARHLQPGEVSKRKGDEQKWDEVGIAPPDLSSIPGMAVDPLEFAGTNPLTEKTVYEPREINNRRIAARVRRQRIEREKAPLFADQIASEQPDPVEELKKHDKGFNQRLEQVDKRAQEKWISYFHEVGKLPADEQRKLLTAWNASSGPKDYAYFAGFLAKWKSGKIDTAEIIDRSNIEDPELRQKVSKLDRTLATLKKMRSTATAEAGQKHLDRRIQEVQSEISQSLPTQETKVDDVVADGKQGVETRAKDDAWLNSSLGKQTASQEEKYLRYKDRGQGQEAASMLQDFYDEKQVPMEKRLKEFRDSSQKPSPGENFLASQAKQSPEAKQAASEMQPGIKNVASRMDQADAGFKDNLKELGGLTDEQAQKAFDYYKENKLIKSDAVMGKHTAKHGAYMDRDVIRKAAGLEPEAKADPSPGSPSQGESMKTIPLRERKSYAEQMAKDGMQQNELADHLMKRGVASVDARKLASDASFTTGVEREEAQKKQQLDDSPVWAEKGSKLEKDGHTLYRGKFAGKGKWAIDHSGGPQGFHDTPEQAIENHLKMKQQSDESEETETKNKAAFDRVKTGKHTDADLKQLVGHSGIGSITKSAAHGLMKRFGLRPFQAENILKAASKSGFDSDGADRFDARDIVKRAKEFVENPNKEAARGNVNTPLSDNEKQGRASNQKANEDATEKAMSNAEKMQAAAQADKKARNNEKLGQWRKAFEGSPREFTAAGDLHRKDFEKARENGISDDRLLEMVDHGTANGMFTAQEAKDLKSRIKPLTAGENLMVSQAKQDAAPIPARSDSPGIVMPSKTVSNEQAKPGDQLGLFGEATKAPAKAPPRLKVDEPKAKQGGLFDTKGNPDQMDLFGDGVMPDDMVYKPKEEAKKPEFNMDSHVKLAANSIDKLRSSDVSRLLEQAPHEHMQAVADHIKANRPDLANKVDDELSDVLEDRGMSPAQKAAGIQPQNTPPSTASYKPKPSPGENFLASQEKTKAAEGFEPYEDKRFPGKWLSPFNKDKQGLGDTIHQSRSEAIDQSREHADRHEREQSAEANRQQQAADEQARKAAFKESGLTPMQAAAKQRADKHLDEMVRHNGKDITTRRKILEKEIAQGRTPKKGYGANPYSMESEDTSRRLTKLEYDHAVGLHAKHQEELQKKSEARDAEIAAFDAKGFIDDMRSQGKSLVKFAGEKNLTSAQRLAAFKEFASQNEAKRKEETKPKEPSEARAAAQAKFRARQEAEKPHSQKAFEAAEAAESKDATPREVAKAAQAQLDKDYEYARASEIGNAGEDLKGSARHRVNAWKGLAAAEKDGSAEKLVNREGLHRLEPHDLMTHADKNPVTSLAMHYALRNFPPAPAGETKTHSAEKNREQYLDAYRAIKDKANELAASTPDHAVGAAVSMLRDFVSNKLREFRGQEGSSALTAKDKYNPTANLLIKTHNALSSSTYKNKNGVMGRLEEFSKEANNKYDNALKPGKLSTLEDKKSFIDKLSNHAKDIIEGHSLNKTFGKESEKRDVKRFDPSEAYVKIATRKGGRDLSKITADPIKAVDHMVKDMGMRGVQWGNSVTDDERKHHAGKALEAIADLADVTGLHPKDIALDGNLGLAIGARGKGTASAHYEPGNKVINLTRANGVGTLAHEWGHAFDHMLNGFGLETTSKGDKVVKRGGYMSNDTDTHEIRPKKQINENNPWVGKTSNPERHEGSDYVVTKRPLSDIRDAYRKLNDVSKGFRERLNKALQDDVNSSKLSAKKANDYWNSDHEIFARSFEQYVMHKMKENGIENTYLAGMSKGHKYWPTPEESKAMAPAFDKIFEQYRKEKHGSGEPIKYSRREAFPELFDDDSQYSPTVLARYGFNVAEFADHYAKYRGEKTPSLFANDDGPSWITIGAQPGSDGRKTGGHPVKISDEGKMLTGHFAGMSLADAFGPGNQKQNEERKQPAPNQSDREPQQAFRKPEIGTFGMKLRKPKPPRMFPDTEGYLRALHAFTKKPEPFASYKPWKPNWGTNESNTSENKEFEKKSLSILENAKHYVDPDHMGMLERVHFGNFPNGRRGHQYSCRSSDHYAGKNQMKWDFGDDAEPVSGGKPSRIRSQQKVQEAANNGRLKIVGTTSDHDECERCGRKDLSKTIVVETLDAQGNGTGELHYYGSDCISKIMGKSEKHIETKVMEADYQKFLKSKKEAYSWQSSEDLEYDESACKLAADLYCAMAGLYSVDRYEFREQLHPRDSIGRFSKVRSLVERPDIANHHSLFALNQDTQTRLYVTDSMKGFRNLLGEASRRLQAKGGDGSEESLWQEIDKDKLRTMLAEVNAKDKEMRKNGGKGIDELFNYNGVIPKMIAERLSGGSRFFDPQKLKAKWHEQAPPPPAPAPEPTQAPAPGSNISIDMPKAKRGKQPTNAEPKAPEKPHDGLSTRKRNEVNKVIADLVSDNPEVIEEFRPILIDAWKRKSAEVNDRNNGFRQILGIFGKPKPGETTKPGEVTGMSPAQLMNLVKAARNKTLDPSTKKNFDVMVASAEAGPYGHLLEGNGEEGLMSLIEEGIKPMPDILDDDVAQLALGMAGPSFFQGFDPGEAPEEQPSEWEETPFSSHAAREYYRANFMEDWEVDLYALTQMMFDWDEASHPREPKGAEGSKGGEFAKKTSGEVDRGYRNVVSGAQSSPSDIASYKNTDRPIGVSVQPRPLSPRVVGLLAQHAEHGKNVFLDSGIASTVSKGEGVDFTKVFSKYREILEQVSPSHRHRVMVVAPDHLEKTAEGEFRGDQDKTLDLQSKWANEIKEIQDMGASVIVPVQRGEQGLSAAAALATDAIDFSNGKTIFGIPYNKGAWDDKSILDFARKSKGTEAKIHLLGGGKQKVDVLTQKLHEIDPDMIITGDAASELRNRSRKQKKEAEKSVQLKDGYVLQPRAKVGGEHSDVDGKFYKGGSLMPVHGMFSGMEKPPAKEKKSDGTSPVAKEDQDKQPRQIRQRSAQDIEAERERMEGQRRWDELNAGPIKDLFHGWIGDRPNSKAFKGSPGHKFWAPMAERLGKDGVEKLTEFMRTKAIEREKRDRKEPMYSNVKKGMIDPKEQIAAYVENIEWLAKDSQHFHTKKHLKAVPNSRAGEVWLDAFIADSSIDDKLELNSKLKELLGSEKTKYSWQGNVEKYSSPSKAQAEAGNYRMKHVRVAGLDISIETPKGKRRRPEWPPMAADYGYIKGTTGRDGDHLDVFVGPKPNSEIVYVIDQANKEGGFDEHKIMLGFVGMKNAVDCYKRCYTPGWKVGPVTAMTIGQFKNWIRDGKHKKPIEMQVSKYSSKSEDVILPASSC
jgi:hypothetical protein